MDFVKAGEPLVMKEAMKMKYRSHAEADSIGERVLAREGDGPAVDAVILAFR